MTLEIDYTDYNGERKVKEIVPIRVYIDNNESYQNKQWLLEAIDMENNKTKTFVMDDIHNNIELTIISCLHSR